MLAVAQMEEQWIVAPQVAGSSPVSHPSRVGSIGTVYVNRKFGQSLIEN